MALGIRGGTSLHLSGLEAIDLLGHSKDLRLMNLDRTGNKARIAKARNQKRFNLVIVTLMLVATVIIAALALTHTASVTLPGYLNQCVPLDQKPVYISTPTMEIFINGQLFPIPAGIGVHSPCVRPINTRTTQDPEIIHIDAYENRTYTVGDFFLVWGETFGNQFALFNKDQLFFYKTGNGHNITMSIDGFPSRLYENSPFARNANASSSPYNVIISYA